MFRANIDNKISFESNIRQIRETCHQNVHPEISTYGKFAVLISSCMCRHGNLNPTELPKPKQDLPSMVER